jgi:hypothetical protein
MLEGVWEAQYGVGTDKIILKEDGRFKQIYQDHIDQNYIFETPWNNWHIERMSNGFTRIHLEGGRYYLAGNDFADIEGKKVFGTSSLYDPFSQGFVTIEDELILVVVQDQTGELILHHLWTSSDRGFALFGGTKEVFYKVNPESNN